MTTIRFLVFKITGGKTTYYSKYHVFSLNSGKLYYYLEPRIQSLSLVSSPLMTARTIAATLCSFRLRFLAFFSKSKVTI